MSRNYLVNVTLGIHYNKANILKIIKKGGDIGFTYYDYIFGHRYEESPVLTPEEAFYKYIQLKNDPDANHALYSEISKGHFSHISFYNDSGYLQVSLGAFAYMKEKSFENSDATIDFEFYIIITLKLAHDFGILKLDADYID